MIVDGRQINGLGLPHRLSRLPCHMLARALIGFSSGYPFAANPGLIAVGSNLPVYCDVGVL